MEGHVDIQQINTDKDCREWDGVISSFESGTFFHTSYWLNIIENAYELKPCHLILRSKEEPVLAMPLFSSENALHSPFMAEYGGACVSDKLVKDTVQVKAAFESLFNKIAQIGKEEGVPAAYVRGHYDNRTMDYFLIDGSYKKIARHLTYVLSDFYGIEDTMSMFHKKTRNAVRKAIKEGLTVEPIDTNSEAMKEYIGLHVITKRKHGSEPFNDTFFDMLHTIPSENIDIRVVRYDDVCIAGLLSFLFNGKIHIFDNCSEPDYLKFNPNHILYYSLIEMAKERKMEVDFGKTSPDHHSLRQFKGRWGGKMHSFHTYMKIMPPVVRNTIIMGAGYFKRHGARETAQRIARRRQ